MTYSDMHIHALFGVDDGAKTEEIKKEFLLSGRVRTKGGSYEAEGMDGHSHCRLDTTDHS